MKTEVWIALIAASAGASAAIATVIVKWLNRQLDTADAGARTSAGKKDDLEVLRGVISELREDKAEATQRIDALETRMAKLEERERHALTRAAVHEAWDQMAFAMLLRSDPNHPPPPPLTPPRLAHKPDDFDDGDPA